MLAKCNDNTCNCDEIHEEMMNEVDSKIESLKEYIVDNIATSTAYWVKELREYVQEEIKKKTKKMLLYILPPLAFLLLLAMIL